MEVWIQEVLRLFFSLLDTVIYWAISLFATLFDNLSGIKVFSDTTLNDFSTRLYIFISIIMIFKVSFSILQYIINPDNFTNSEKGVGKLVQSILMCLVAIVVVPHAFNIAYDFEKKFVETRIIESIIFGNTAKDNMSDKEKENINNQMSNSKERMSFYLLRAFIVPNLQAPNVTYDKIEGYKIGGEPLYIKNDRGIYEVNEKWPSTSLSNDALTYVASGMKAETTTKVGDIYKESLKNFNTEGLLVITKAKSTNQDIFAMNYRFGFSTVTGVLALILYINFCFDLAKRVVKFSFLQLIAPIPIISMVDPKSSKSGLMSKWIKNCLSTYAGLFIRIVAVNFAVYTVSIVFESSNNGVFNAGMGETGLFIQVMIVFGALMFAKELPKLITDLTGIDMKGDFKLNPFKRIPGLETSRRVLGTAASGLVGGVAGAVAGASASQGFGRFGRFLGGALKGTAGGLQSGISSKGKNVLKNGMTAGRNYGDRVSKLQGSNFFDRNAAKISTALGVSTEADRMDEQIKNLETYAKFKGQLKDQSDFDTTNLMQVANERGRDYSEILGSGASDIDIRKAALGGVKGLKQYYNDLQNSGTATQEQITAARTAWENAQQFVITHASDGVLGKYDDNGNFVSTQNTALATIKKQAVSYVNKYSDSFKGDNFNTARSGETYEDINKAFIAAQNKIIEIRGSDDYMQAKINKEAAASSKK